MIQSRPRIEKMSKYFTVSNSAFGYGLKAHQLAVYMYLCRCGNNGGTAFPSYSDIAKKCGMSRRKAIYVMNELIEMGLVKRHVKRGDQRRHYSNIYVVLDPEDVLSQPSSECNAPPSARSAPPSARSAPPSAQNAPYKEPTKKEPCKKGNNVSLAAESPEAYTHDLSTYVQTTDPPEKFCETVTYFLANYFNFTGKKHPRIKGEQVDKVMETICEQLDGFSYESIMSIIDTYFAGKNGDKNINHFVTVLPRYVNRFYDDA